MPDSKLQYQCMCLMAGMFPRLWDKNVDAIFIWGRADGDWQDTRYDHSVLHLAGDLCRQTRAKVVIPGYDGRDKGQGDKGYPGPLIWRSSLKIFGVSDDDVIETVGNGTNTKTEMDDFLELAVFLKWTTVVAITQQMRALRAMLGTVKSLNDRNLHNLIVVPAWPYYTDLSRECYGSQGAGPYPRVHWINEEYERIPRYQQKGDLATLDELYQYLLNIHQHLE